MRFGFEDEFSERAKNVLELAKSAASELGHTSVGSEHILLGIVRDGGDTAAKILLDEGLDEKLIYALILKNSSRGTLGNETTLSLTPSASRIIEIAMIEAQRLGHNYVGPEHLFMGILREYESVAAKLILSTGVDLNKLYTSVISLFGSNVFKPFFF